VKEVREGSPCYGLVMPGDLVLEIGGRRPRDILDYMETAQEKRIKLRLLRGDREIVLKVRKQDGEPPGLVFEEAVFDGLRICRNKCLFCFVDQMPSGMRPSLYVKDDDYRMSFYYGNFVTLNNLSKEDLHRIIRLRLSPLYVSLHATDPSLRQYMMGGNAVRGLDALRLILEKEIMVHLQVVVCPGINDGENLHNTMREIMNYHAVASLGVVPVGMTRLAASISRKLIPHDQSSSNEVLRTVEEYQELAMEIRGKRIFYAADEFYLMAGKDFPAQGEYDGYPQLENGVGMARKFMDEVRRYSETRDLWPRCQGKAPSPRKGVLTGEAGAKVIRPIIEKYFPPGSVELVAVENKLFGGSVNVTSLLGGKDIIAALKKRRYATRRMLIPESMLRDGRFLDDLDAEDVKREAGVELVPVEVEGSAFIKALLS